MLESAGSNLRVIDEQVLDFGCRGNRIALLTRIALDLPPADASPDSPSSAAFASDSTAVAAGRTIEFVLVNNHLTFPHCCLDVQLRGQQARQLTRFVDEYVAHHALHDAPVFLAGDFNGTNDTVVRHLRACGFASAFELANGGREARVTHLNHRHEAVPVDYVFVRPSLSASAFAAAAGAANTTVTHSVASLLHASRTRSAASIQTVGALLLPASVSDASWPSAAEWTLSDHRPVVASFTLERAARPSLSVAAAAATSASSAVSGFHLGAVPRDDSGAGAGAGAGAAATGAAPAARSKADQVECEACNDMCIRSRAASHHPAR